MGKKNTELKSVTINSMEIPVKEYDGQRVVTFKEIDAVHGRADGTARKRFNDNKERFIERTDYFKISPSEFRTAIGAMDLRQQNDVTLVTESGYLMLVKSFTDDLAWSVQRQLVNVYFRAKEAIPQKPMTDYQRRSLELREKNLSIKSANFLSRLAKKYRGNAFEQTLDAYATKEISGEVLVPLPDIEDKTYSAGEIGRELGISANAVGRIANENKLKTTKYGKWFVDRARGVNEKSVQSFRYYWSVVPVIQGILRERKM